MYRFEQLSKSLRWRGRNIASRLMYWSGGGRLLKLAGGLSGATVLMYHSVADGDDVSYVDPPNRISPELFEDQMAFLSAHRCVVSLSSLAQMLVRGDFPSSPCVCITFDDGYLDNLFVAAPILEKYRLPATLFLATGYVTRGEAQWADSLYWIFTARKNHRLSIPDIGLSSIDLVLNEHVLEARKTIHRYMLESNQEARSTLLAELRYQLCPEGRPPRLTLNWDDVRELCQRYPSIEIGGHTRDHIDLRTHGGDFATEQITGCADDILREVGIVPLLFSFPYGRWCPETIELVRTSGWLSAVADGDARRVGVGTDRFRIPRVNAPCNMREFAYVTSGMYRW